MEEKKNKPWERQEGESEKAFEAFAAFRDMGEKRTVAAVAEKLSKSRQLLFKWKSAWDWENRVKAYDNDLEKQYHAKRKKLIAETKDRQLKISYSLEKKGTGSARPLRAVRNDPARHQRNAAFGDGDSGAQPH